MSTNFTPCDTDTIVQQLGGANLAGISGGRVEHRETGISLPVGSGYRVTVDLAADDTYTVRRVFTRGPRAWVKGEMTGVYCDQVGEVAYQASCFRSSEKWGSNPHPIDPASLTATRLQSRAVRLTERGRFEVTPLTAVEVDGVRIAETRRVDALAQRLASEFTAGGSPAVVLPAGGEFEDMPELAQAVEDGRVSLRRARAAAETRRKAARALEGRTVRPRVWSLPAPAGSGRIEVEGVEVVDPAAESASPAAAKSEALIVSPSDAAMLAKSPNLNIFFA